MSNINLKVIIEKNWSSQNFDFLSLKYSPPCQFLGSSNSRRYHWILKLLVATYKSDIWEQKYVRLFYYFNFERGYDVLKSKSRCILLKKNKILIKRKQNRKWKIPHTVWERQILCFSSCKNSKLKVKLWWIGARERKNKTVFVSLILPEGNSFKICVLSQCKVYWIHFQNMHIFTYQKTLLHPFLLFA